MIILTPQVNGKKKKTKLAAVSEIKEKFPISGDSNRNTTARQGCGSGPAWIRINFFLDPDPGRKIEKEKRKNARKLVMIVIL